jgi:D-alanyl-D-alanine carboxypeptidase (penicillin-binding protein 5/6)
MTAAKVILCAIALFSTTVSASAFDTLARSALVVDVQTGTVLYAKDAERPIPPASMSKLMTLNMLFEALNDGRVGLDTTFVVSNKAHLMGGSKMFLRQGERVSVENLIHGIIVLSGNDACVVVAEALEGSEAEFARKMTERAKKLGMKNSSFANSTGWPHPAQRMSAEDLVFLAKRLITEFPEYYTNFAKDTFTWANITQENRNPLLKLNIGADGLKTGHTQEAGYGLVGSAIQGERRVIFMITGLDSSAARATEGERIINWAFRNFVKKTILEKDAVIGTADVWLGRKDTVELYSPTEITALIPYDAVEDYEASIKYKGPIEAPIEKDAQVATLVLKSKDMTPVEYPLYAKTDIRKGGLFSRMKTSANKLKDEVIGTSDDR